MVQALSAAELPGLRRRSEPNRFGSDARRVRIAFIAISYAAQRDGVSIYAENLLFELLSLADERGLHHEFDVFACGRAAEMLQSRLRSRAGESATAGVRVIATAKEGFSAKYLQAPWLVRAYGPYDAAFVPNLQPLWLPRVRALGVLHDLTYRVARAYFPPWRAHYMDLLTRFWLWRGAAIGCISRTCEADLEHHYPHSRRKRHLYLPNGLPDKLARTSRPSPAAIQQKFEKQRIELLFVGRVNRLKGFDRVHGICKRLDDYAASRDVPITVHVVGKDTKESPALLAAFALRRVELTRHGYVDDGMLNALYRRSAFCLLLSRNEGFGLPLLESIWQGCVPLLSDIAIFREVMGTGYPLFADDDAGQAALVGFIDHLRSDRPYREEILARMDNVLARWAGGYTRAAGTLLDWVSEDTGKLNRP